MIGVGVGGRRLSQQTLFLMLGFLVLACRSTLLADTIWNPSLIPAQIDSRDRNAVELGVRFQADVEGVISGIGFYKARTNTGTHVASLWSNTGTLLAQATFHAESASGWQQVNFSTPVPISANTIYVASYHTNVGSYSDTLMYFAHSSYSNGHLTALQDGSGGADGVFLYSSSPGFPVNTFRSTNYWVDVVFTASASQRTHCIPAPHLCGYPDATNTGVPAGTALTPSGTLTVTVPGSIIDSVLVTGQILVRANNVTIKRSKIISNHPTGIEVDTGVTGVTVEDSEVDGQNTTNNIAGIGYSGFTAVRVNVHGFTDSVRSSGSGVLVQDSYFHDLSTASSSQGHQQCISMFEGSNLTIQHNTCLWPNMPTAAVFIKSDNGAIHNVVVRNNLLDGGDWTVYSVDGGHGLPTHVRVVNNQFGHDYLQVSSNSSNPMDLEGTATEAGNVWDDTGQPFD
jgi:hypothetical protein